MSFASTMAKISAEQAELVTQETFGHLAPQKGKTYKGHIIFAVGCFGSDDINPTPLECEFEGLDSSPWFFEAMNDFLRDLKTEAGKVYRFDGRVRNYKFRGKVRELILS